MAEYYRNGWYTPLTKKIDKNTKDIKELDEAVEALESEVPDPPEVNGIYSLKAIIESGEGEVEWVEDEKELPDTPSVDGTYSLKVDVESGDGSPEWVEDENELPTSPVADGEYALKETVSNGGVTKEWVTFPTGGGTHNYSTSEQVIGTWIDGKPIYECTYDNIYLSAINGTYVEVQAISATDIDTIIDFFALASDGTDPWQKRLLKFPVVQKISNNSSIRVLGDAGTAMITCTRAVIRYTKVSDTPSV